MYFLNKRAFPLWLWLVRTYVSAAITLQCRTKQPNDNHPIWILEPWSSLFAAWMQRTQQPQQIALIFAAWQQAAQDLLSMWGIWYCISIGRSVECPVPIFHLLFIKAHHELHYFSVWSPTSAQMSPTSPPHQVNLWTHWVVVAAVRCHDTATQCKIWQACKASDVTA